MTLLNNISVKSVYDHYVQREAIHFKLLELFRQQKIDDFANLAVGVSDQRANYSASEYGGGVLILQRNSTQAIYNLANELYSCADPNYIPDIVIGNQFGL